MSGMKNGQALLHGLEKVTYKTITKAGTTDKRTNRGGRYASTQPSINRDEGWRVRFIQNEFNLLHTLILFAPEINIDHVVPLTLLQWQFQ